MKCFVSVTEWLSSVTVDLRASEEGAGIRTMGYEAAKVAADNAMPRGTLPFIEL